MVLRQNTLYRSLREKIQITAGSCCILKFRVMAESLNRFPHGQININVLFTEFKYTVQFFGIVLSVFKASQDSLGRSGANQDTGSPNLSHS